MKLQPFTDQLNVGKINVPSTPFLLIKKRTLRRIVSVDRLLHYLTENSKRRVSLRILQYLGTDEDINVYSFHCTCVPIGNFGPNTFIF